jgi:hypothetical protein
VNVEVFDGSRDCPTIDPTNEYLKEFSETFRIPLHRPLYIKQALMPVSSQGIP